MVARAFGAAVSITDVSDYKLEKARERGIDWVVNMSREDLGPAIRRCLGPDRADLFSISSWSAWGCRRRWPRQWSTPAWARPSWSWGCSASSRWWTCLDSRTASSPGGHVYVPGPGFADVDVPCGSLAIRFFGMHPTLNMGVTTDSISLSISRVNLMDAR